MHPYQIEDKIKIGKTLAELFFSIIAAYGLNCILRQIPSLVIWWIDYPSVLGFFGIFIWLFDNYIWKLSFIQKSRWLLTPNLNGTWKTEIKTSSDNFANIIHCQMEIHQTGSRMLVTLETDDSISHSVHAAILPSGKKNSHEIMYNFINEPKADAKHTMNIHYGTAWCQISNDFNRLDGEYFTGRGRQTFGRVKARRA